MHVAEAYQSASVGSMEREEAMGKVVYLLAKHSVTTGYFEITVSVSCTSMKRLFVVCLCYHVCGVV